MINRSPNSNALTHTTNEIIDSRLRSGETMQFTISTRSMLPTLAPDDHIFVRGFRADQPSVGDIVLIRSDRYWLAHRIIDRRAVKGKLFFMTQGDYGTEPDGLWSLEQIYGKIVSVERNGTSHSLESTRAQWSSVAIAYLLRLRLKLQKALALKMNAALIRSAAWLGQGARTS